MGATIFCPYLDFLGLCLFGGHVFIRLPDCFKILGKSASLGEGTSMNAGSFAPALVLNADFRPLNYFPLSLWSWQETIKAVCLDRVTIICEYEQFISSPSLKINLPSVIALKEYVPQKRNPAFTRFNVFLRDRFSCHDQRDKGK